MISRCSNHTPTQVRPELNGTYQVASKIEHFVCYMRDGWYVETRYDEYGPFQSLREAEDFCESRFNAVESWSHERHE